MAFDDMETILNRGTKELVIRCPIGKNILGGGGSVEIGAPGVSVQSRPHLSCSPVFPSRTSWSVLVLNHSGTEQIVGAIQGYAICAETDAFIPDVEFAFTDNQSSGITRIFLDNPNQYTVIIEYQLLLSGEPIWPDGNCYGIAGESSVLLTIFHPPCNVDDRELLLYDVNPAGIPDFYEPGQ